jgi:hypothetical protein
MSTKEFKAVLRNFRVKYGVFSFDGELRVDRLGTKWTDLDMEGIVFREIVRATPLGIGLTYALCQNAGIPFGWAAAFAALATPTLWLVPMLNKEFSRR